MLQAPNQRIPIYSGNHYILVSLRTFDGMVFASIDVDNEPVVASRRVVIDDDLMGYPCNSRRFGSLYVRQKYDTALTETTAYNVAIYIEYEPPTEV